MQRDLGVNLPARAWPQDEMPLPPADPTRRQHRPNRRSAAPGPQRAERPRTDFADEGRAPLQPRLFGGSPRGERSPARRRFGGACKRRPRRRPLIVNLTLNHTTCMKVRTPSAVSRLSVM